MIRRSPAKARPDRSATDALERMYTEHASMVTAVCRGFLRDSLEAEDAAQTTFLSAQRALANGSAPRDPAAWLATIARNECLARVRARAWGTVPLADEAGGSAPDAHAAAVRREQVGELRDALADLPAQQREAILLRELRGLSYDEVAASLAVSTSAVESLIFRARRGLQLRLREAAAAFSPAGWLALLREQAARLVGGALAAPAAAKVVAVGVGTAVVAGGAAVSPRVAELLRDPSAHGPPAHVTHQRRVPPTAIAAAAPPPSVVVPLPAPQRAATSSPVVQRASPVTMVGSGTDAPPAPPSPAETSFPQSSGERGSGGGETTAQPPPVEPQPGLSQPIAADPVATRTPAENGADQGTSPAAGDGQPAQAAQAGNDGGGDGNGGRDSGGGSEAAKSGGGD